MPEPSFAVSMANLIVVGFTVSTWAEFKLERKRVALQDARWGYRWSLLKNGTHYESACREMRMFAIVMASAIFLLAITPLAWPFSSGQPWSFAGAFGEVAIVCAPFVLISAPLRLRRQLFNFLVWSESDLDEMQVRMKIASLDAAVLEKRTPGNSALNSTPSSRRL